MYGFSISFARSNVKVMSASRKSRRLSHGLPSSCLRWGSMSLSLPWWTVRNISFMFRTSFSPLGLVGSGQSPSSREVFSIATFLRRKNSPSESKIPRAFCTIALSAEFGFSTRSSWNESITVVNALAISLAPIVLVASAVTDSCRNFAITGVSLCFITFSAPSIRACNSYFGRNRSKPASAVAVLSFATASFVLRISRGIEANMSIKAIIWSCKTQAYGSTELCSPFWNLFCTSCSGLAANSV
mmetsp:Transcript_88349/g.202038  ORF Transcript_88349/g.202038 Transcript_88349/m.202038 type:complete len:243 (-) Transcript_88349:2131-2859(-)